MDNKTILVTGGTGSFGQEFVRQALIWNPKTIRIFSRGELLQDDMRAKFRDSRLRFIIGDVRDRNRVFRAMDNVDIVVHAAAMKQVPTCEYNPIEAVKTNIEGSCNVVDAAIDQGVDKVIGISTDKAVHPVNLYGSTKKVMEHLMVQANAYSGHRTKFSCVRYGNVVGSRGSIVPLFEKQKLEGRLTITDERMTRFWIKLEQAVKFVIDCLYRMQGGEIFIPEIQSKRITDVANEIAPGIPRDIVGIRPGEKIHEILLTTDESRHARRFPGYFVVEPEFPFRQWSTRGEPLEEGFEYTSEKC